MQITIFEEQGFANWCKEGVSVYIVSILKRACTLLLSTTINKRDLKKYSMGEEILFDNLNLIDLNYEEILDDSKLFNTCLLDRCLTIVYDDILLEKVCRDRGVNFANMEFFLNRLSNYVTDSVIVEWKNYRGLPISYIKIENPKTDSGFFPMSSNLNELIKLVQSLTTKRIIFSSVEGNYPIVGKDSITCYFSTERIESEYLIAEQLIRIYMANKGFPTINKFHFLIKENWIFNDETLYMAIGILLQNKYVNLFISDLYPIYFNDMVYSLLNFRNNEDYMSPACRYLCEYSKKNKLCEICLGIDDVFSNDISCPLYNEDSILDRIFTLDEMGSPEQQERLILEYANKYKTKK